jgi:hypothetical protein
VLVPWPDAQPAIRQPGDADHDAAHRHRIEVPEGLGGVQASR